MQIPSLMGAVKITKTNVNDARGQIITIINGNFDIAGKFGHRFIRQAGDG
jgi:hypothetical protein